jgi:hypothetical protein
MRYGEIAGWSTAVAPVPSGSPGAFPAQNKTLLHTVTPRLQASGSDESAVSDPSETFATGDGTHS